MCIEERQEDELRIVVVNEEEHARDVDMEQVKNRALCGNDAF